MKKWTREEIVQGIRAKARELGISPGEVGPSTDRLGVRLAHAARRRFGGLGAAQEAAGYQGSAKKVGRPRKKPAPEPTPRGGVQTRSGPEDRRGYPANRPGGGPMTRRNLFGAALAAALSVPWEKPKGSVGPKSLLRSRTGPKSWTGSHDQERERRRRQIERGSLRPTPDFAWDVVGPVLAAEQEGAEARRAEMLHQGEFLVHEIARKLRLTAGVPADHDLAVPGMVGLQHALDTFDPERGLAFSTFAAPRIRGAILDHLRRQEVRHA